MQGGSSNNLSLGVADTETGCNCLLVQNISNKRLRAHLAHSPSWKSPAEDQQMDMVRMKA